MASVMWLCRIAVAFCRTRFVTLWHHDLSNQVEVPRFVAHLGCDCGAVALRFIA